MMVKEGEFVAVFNSIHRVMKAEKLLKEKKLQILLIPVPRALASDCGLAIRYTAAEREQVELVLSQASILPEELYLKEGKHYNRVV